MNNRYVFNTYSNLSCIKISNNYFLIKKMFLVRNYILVLKKLLFTLNKIRIGVRRMKEDNVTYYVFVC